MDCKKDDIIHVRMTVVRSEWERSVDAVVDGQVVTVPRAEIVNVEMRPPKVGDTVRHERCGWTVKAVEGNELWLKRGYDGRYKSVSVIDLSTNPPK